MYLDLPPGMRSFARSAANPIVPGELVEALRQAARELQLRQAPEQEPAE
jgi:hypothetical protein